MHSQSVSLGRKKPRFSTSAAIRLEFAGVVRLSVKKEANGGETIVVEQLFDEFEASALLPRLASPQE
jgi:hypothetical protein